MYFEATVLRTPRSRPARSEYMPSLTTVHRQALVMANTRFEHLKTATFGIIFLGTPHRGSPQAKLGQIVANLARISFTRPQTQVLKLLESNSHELDALSEEFSELHATLKIVSCYEQKETKISYFKKLMVGMRIQPKSLQNSLM